MTTTLAPIDVDETQLYLLLSMNIVFRRDQA